jgi:hypothetical protein
MAAIRGSQTDDDPLAAGSRRPARDVMDSRSGRNPMLAL